MSGPIKPGDLVMVVKSNRCCGSAKSVGHIFTVSEIKPQSICRCDNCGRDSIGTFVGRVDHPGSGEYLPQIAKIDPPAEGDSLPTRQDLEITA